LEYNEIQIELIRDTILEILNNDTYSENMKAKSKLFRDQREMPLARAIWWIEFVLRNPNKTSQKLMNLNYFQYHSFDVVLTLISIMIGAIGLFWIIIRKVVKYLPKSTADNTVTTKTIPNEAKKPSEKIE
jgi:glucuronosyltransferase